jgi:diguanylate cyclase
MAEPAQALDRGALLDALARGGGLLACVVVDLDRFADVNSLVGDDGGDQVLDTVLRRVMTVAPRCQALARLRADRFAIVVAPPDDPAVIAERIRRAVSEPLPAAEPDLRLTVSVGVARLIGEADPSIVLRTAEHALRDAKRLGGDIVSSADVVPDAAAARLSDAIDAGHLDVAYQPIVCLDRGIVLGAEALVRWADPEIGLLPPDWFLPAAAQRGLIERIGAVVATTAIGAVAELQHEHGRHDLRCTINLHTRELDDARLGPRLAHWVNERGLAPGTLHVEVSERELRAASAPRLGELRACGLRIGLDDVGTGAGAFATIARLPIDTLKVDRRAALEVRTTLRASTFHALVADLAHALGAEVVGEGAESEDDLAAIVAMGGTAAQGTLFARPAGVDALDAVLRQPAFWWRFTERSLR